jgi:uncharacterized phiE125 gp8 family phage protein
VITAWSLTSAPAEEPVTLHDIRSHLRVTHDREDGLLYGYGQAARRAAEAYLARGLMAQTWTLSLSEWADEIPLPMAWPLASVTTVKYHEPVAGVLTTLSASVYAVDTRSVPGRLRRAPGQSWPGLQSDNAFPIQIAYVVGVADRSNVDSLITQGILMHAAHLHLDREGSSPDGEAARKAAERLWTLAGRLETPEPRCA